MKNLLKVINGFTVAIIIAFSFSLVCCDGKPNNNPSTEKNSSTEVNRESPETEYFTLTFDSDGGSRIDSQVIEKGGKAKEPTVPTKTDSTCEYEFTGWYSGDKKWDFDVDTVAGDITLKAGWKLIAKYGPEILP